MSRKARGESISKGREVGHVCPMLVRDQVTWEQKGNHTFEKGFGDLHRKSHGRGARLEYVEGLIMWAIF